MAYNDRSNAQVILTIGAVSGLMVLVLTIGLQAWFVNEERAELDRQYAAIEHKDLVSLQKKQAEKIGTYHWIDREKQIAAVPIDQAMKMLIANKGKLPNP